MSKADVGEFLTKLNVRRVRDMKASQVAEARSLINGLAGESFEVEVDPFA